MVIKYEDIVNLGLDQIFLVDGLVVNGVFGQFFFKQFWIDLCEVFMAGNNGTKELILERRNYKISRIEENLINCRLWKSL